MPIIYLYIDIALLFSFYIFQVFSILSLFIQLTCFISPQLTMKPEIEQELSHTLLTELLAYQFASPVRWIETQDVFLKQHNTERIIEIGPSPTLAGMANRTIKAKYESYDAALSLQRQVLCYSKDAKEIYYKPDPADLAPKETPKQEESTPSAPAAALQHLLLPLPLLLLQHLQVLAQLNLFQMNQSRLTC